MYANVGATPFSDYVIGKVQQLPLPFCEGKPERIHFDLRNSNSISPVYQVIYVRLTLYIISCMQNDLKSLLAPSCHIKV